jgi:hypothetical protein
MKPIPDHMKPIPNDTETEEIASRNLWLNNSVQIINT